MIRIGNVKHISTNTKIGDQAELIKQTNKSNAFRHNINSMPALYDPERKHQTGVQGACMSHVTYNIYMYASVCVCMCLHTVRMRTK